MSVEVSVSVCDRSSMRLIKKKLIAAVWVLIIQSFLDQGVNCARSSSSSMEKRIFFLQVPISNPVPIIAVLLHCD